MKIIKGKFSGFCGGVNLTYEKAKETLKKEPVYCLGQIIHNEQVIKELEDQGMITVNEITSIPDHSKVIFRAHGETIENYEYAKSHDIEVIDLTCPKVNNVHQKVINHNDEYIIIIGKKNHPEVIATSSYAKLYYIIENEDDLDSAYQDFKSSKLAKLYIVSQTTFSKEKFNMLVELIKKLFKDETITVDNTICDATSLRQNEVSELSKSSSKVLVIGSKNSSNTKELYNIAINNCKDTYFIENKADIKDIKFNKEDIVSVVAGASAPRWLIDEIISEITLLNI